MPENTIGAIFPTVFGSIYNESRPFAAQRAYASRVSVCLAPRCGGDCIMPARRAPGALVALRRRSVPRVQTQLKVSVVYADEILAQGSVLNTAALKESLQDKDVTLLKVEDPQSTSSPSSPSSSSPPSLSPAGDANKAQDRGIPFVGIVTGVAGVVVVLALVCFLRSQTTTRSSNMFVSLDA